MLSRVTCADAGHRRCAEVQHPLVQVGQITHDGRLVGVSDWELGFTFLNTQGLLQKLLTYGHVFANSDERFPRYTYYFLFFFLNLFGRLFPGLGIVQYFRSL